MNMVVWSLPCLSQEFNQGPVLRSGLDHVAIAFDFETPDGDYAWSELRFSGVVAFAFTAARYCTEDQIAAYDKLLQIEGSPWLVALPDGAPGVCHLRIFFDDAGCYDVLARAFEFFEHGTPPASA